jgi:hypothetical protein
VINGRAIINDKIQGSFTWITLRKFIKIALIKILLAVQRYKFEAFTLHKINWNLRRWRKTGLNILINEAQ